MNTNEWALPQTPRFSAFAPGFLDRETSCARAPGIPAPESALGLRLRRALPSAQVRSVYQGYTFKKDGRLHKRLDAPRHRRVRNGSTQQVLDLHHFSQRNPRSRTAQRGALGRYDWPTVGTRKEAHCGAPGGLRRSA